MLNENELAARRRTVLFVIAAIAALGFIAAALSINDVMQASYSSRQVSAAQPAPIINATDNSNAVAPASVSSLPSTSTTKPSRRSMRRPNGFLVYLPGMVDRSKVLESAEAFTTGTFQNCRLISDSPARIVLNDTNPRSFPREGQWTSRIYQADIPFTEFISYWNADVPDTCGIWVETSFKDHATGKWSAWLYAGQFGRPVPVERIEHFDGGDLREDTWELTKAADAFAFRVHLDSYSMNPAEVPDLRRLGVLYSGVVPADELAKFKKETPEPIGWVRDLPVPYRAQGDTPSNLRYQLCSPTSTSMVLSYWGIDRPTVTNALGIYDAEHQLFGNWNHAVQYAASLGLDAWLKRFRNWDQVKAEIASGTPVIASIKFGAGEFPSEILSSSNGHLIVIRGFTADGNVICNDPGKRTGRDVVYKASELGHAWFDKSGVGYVIKPQVRATQPSATQPSAKTLASK